MLRPFLCPRYLHILFRGSFLYGFPCFHFLFAARRPMSVPLSSGKGQQTIRVTSRPNAPKPSPPIKSSCFAAYFIGEEPCLIPSSSALCCPRNETDILRALNAKKNVSTMKTERSYHSQNRFETKRRLLALPHKIVWIVVYVVALKAIGTSEELTAILTLLGCDMKSHR